MASEPVLGKLSVRVVRGHNLIVADPLTHTSDPYVVLYYGSQVRPSSLIFFPVLDVGAVRVSPPAAGC